MFRVSSKILAWNLENGKICRSRAGSYCLPGHEISPEDLLSEALILKDSRTTTCGVKGALFVKRYNRKKIWKSLKRIFGYPRAYRCMAVSLLLEELPILTPKVFHASRYFLVTEALDEKENIFLSMEPGLVKGFLPVLAQLHNAGVFHGDLSLRNIYFDRKKEMYGLIDFDGAVFYRHPLPPKARALELARILSSYVLTRCGMKKEASLELLLEEELPIYEEIAGMKLDREIVFKRAGELFKHY